MTAIARRPPPTISAEVPADSSVSASQATSAVARTLRARQRQDRADTDQRQTDAGAGDVSRHLRLGQAPSRPCIRRVNCFSVVTRSDGASFMSARRSIVQCAPRMSGCER